MANAARMVNPRAAPANVADVVLASDALRPNPAPLNVQSRMLASLSLGGNMLGIKFANAVSGLFDEYPGLTLLDLQGNSLGVDGGTAVLSALSRARSLRSLDLSSNKLCGIPGSWCGDVLDAIPTALVECKTLEELNLDDNLLCGLWPQRAFGREVIMGSYTTLAVDVFKNVLRTSRMPSLRELRQVSPRSNHPCPSLFQVLVLPRTSAFVT